MPFGGATHPVSGKVSVQVIRPEHTDGMAVPVAVFTGPIGVGKTTIATHAGRLLSERNLSHAVMDLPAIGNSWPRSDDDPWNEVVTHANLAACWANFAQRGVERLILSRVLEARSVATRIEEAVPGAAVQVVLLSAPLADIEDRIRRREPQEAADWYLDGARVLVETFATAGVEDVVVDTTPPRSATAIASEALSLLGWI